MNKPGIPKTTQQGFILAATLWLIAFIAVAAAYLAQWAEQTRLQITQQQIATQTEIDMQSTLATLLFLANTQYINTYGMMLTGLTEEQKTASLLGTGLGLAPADENVIKLHDQAYQGVGESIFSLQDESGLIACNTSEPVHLKYLLGLFGLDPTAREDAIARLQDYIDYDDLHRINGAEASQYRQKNKPAPSNRPLVTSWELRNVLAWEEYPDLWPQTLPRLTSSSWDGWPNFNTAPKQVLQTSMGITPEDAEKIIQARNKAPITHLDQLYQILGKGLGIDALSFNPSPSNFFRVSLWHPQSGRVKEIHLELHPRLLQRDYALNNTRPWRTDYQLDIPKTVDQLNAQPRQLNTPLFNANGS